MNVSHLLFYLAALLAISRNAGATGDSEGREVECQPPAGARVIDYGAEWSASMADDDWHPAEDMSLNGWKEFRVPAGDMPAKFFRMKVAD